MLFVYLFLLQHTAGMMKSRGSCNSHDSECLVFSGKVFYYLGPVSFFFSFFPNGKYLFTVSHKYDVLRLYSPPLATHFLSPGGGGAFQHL